MAMRELQIYNTYSRRKEVFEPLHAPHVGMYVCGPTVYGDPHLGHARPSITFDVLFRVLRELGYKVRYVRNITDVGHLEHDADEGEDKIQKKARLESLEPMEVAHHYKLRYEEAMRLLNVLPPSIEPHATGHIIEQIALIEQLLEKGYAYVSEGSVYFDIEKYDAKYHYGALSGRVVEDMLANTRALDGQSEKRNPLDFALWKRADESHIMRWPSPWGEGFPGWHLECSAMGRKYLGDEFDIHGGGLDLMFPHHECEIAQNQASLGHRVVKYWMHNNLITIEGQKMGKSLGNFITLEELFEGKHAKLEQAYGPMTIRFFVLQAHYRSTLDFSNAALQAAEKGLERLLLSVRELDRLSAGKESTFSVEEFEEACWAPLLDDLNTPVLIAKLFEGAKLIGMLGRGEASLVEEDLQRLRELFHRMVFGVLGLTGGAEAAGSDRALETAMSFVLEYRASARASKDYATSDRIRDELKASGVEVQDTADGASWHLK
ncbi:MAG: cysteine--tRNA ligase [Bacteroidetes bacterium]|nr:MAG: cysteine--tRNA ligase [Bacteroidota bacterium]